MKTSSLALLFTAIYVLFSIYRSMTTTNGSWTARQAISIAVLCDRGPTDSGPLMGLVHSLLAHTHSPIVFHYISDHAYFWLDSLHSPPLFQVIRHSTTQLTTRVQTLLRKTHFKTTHPSGKFAMKKLYIPSLDDVFSSSSSSLLVVDDDMVFYKDVTVLWDLIIQQQKEGRVPFSLYCPKDLARVKDYGYLSKYPRNGDSTRYCISGLMGFHGSAKHSIVETFENATANSMKDYPAFYSRMGDQDVVNRVLADQPHLVNIIPCEWQCDYNSCHKLSNDSFVCSNCPTTSVCYAFHFVAQSWDKYIPLSDPSLSWKYYASLNGKELLMQYQSRL